MFQRYNTATARLGRNISEWNIEPIVKCQSDNDPKCNLWIVSPDSPGRGE